MALQNHELKYTRKFKKAAPIPVVTAPSPNTIEGLYGVDLITEVPDKSVCVLINGVKSAHFDLENVTNWEVTGNKLIISTNNSEVWTLSFVNLTEAQLGLTRLEIAMNGGVI